LLSLNTATNAPATRPSKVADESPAALYAVGDSVQVNSNYEKNAICIIPFKFCGVYSYYVRKGIWAKCLNYLWCWCY